MERSTKSDVTVKQKQDDMDPEPAAIWYFKLS
jgi:hypothetical protein